MSFFTFCYEEKYINLIYKVINEEIKTVTVSTLNLLKFIYSVYFFQIHVLNSYRRERSVN